MQSIKKGSFYKMANAGTSANEQISLKIQLIKLIGTDVKRKMHF